MRKMGNFVFMGKGWSEGSYWGWCEIQSVVHDFADDQQCRVGEMFNFTGFDPVFGHFDDALLFLKTSIANDCDGSFRFVEMDQAFRDVF